MVKLSTLTLVWDIEALNQFKEALEYLEEQSKQAPRIVKKATTQAENLSDINWCNITQFLCDM